MTTSDLKHRFDFHPATSDEKRNSHTSVRQACLRLAEHLDEVCPEGWELSLAIAKIEEAMFWGNAALARQAEVRPEVVIDGEADRWERGSDGKYRNGLLNPQTLEDLRAIFGPLSVPLD